MKESMIYKLSMVITGLALLTGIFHYSFLSILESNLRTESNFNIGR